MSGDKELCIPDDKLNELLDEFNSIDLDGNGYLEEDELQRALEIVGFKKVKYEIRDLIEKYDVKHRDGKIDFGEFKALYAELRKQDSGLKFRQAVTAPKVQVKEYGTRCETGGNEDIRHIVPEEEEIAFADWINKKLCDDELCKRYLPFDPKGKDLYEKCRDGIILCKIINKSVPGTIDERAINKGGKLSVYQMHENICLALNSARAIGCSVVNIGAGDIEGGVEHLLLGLLWQIIRLGLLADINLTAHSELAMLLAEGETLSDLRKLSPEALLLRWVNYHLKNAGVDRQIKNFSDDIKDSEVYSHLLQQITPKEKKHGMHSAPSILRLSDRKDRAVMVLENADRLDARAFVTAKDIVAGQNKLNLAFVANLFNHYPGLEKPADMEEEDEEEIVPETREEQTYRNWINSLLKDKTVNHLYWDLRDGLIIFEIYDLIRPGIVDWKRVHKKFSKIKVNFEILENCNYAVELGHACRFSLVGIGGEDLRDCNVTLTLALVWQLMRAYTLAMLTRLSSSGRPIEERQIIDWANEKLAAAGQDKIRSFQDNSLSNGRIILHLIDAVKPESVDWTVVHKGKSEQESLDNASYAISVARKKGARVYALPQDITEVKAKMVMTVFACLMLVDQEGNVGAAS